MVGNQQADSTADEATALYGTDLLNIAGWFHDRAKAYVSFMRKVSHHIVEAYIIHRQLIDNDDEAPDTQAGGDRGSAYAPLSYPQPVKCRKLAHHASVINHAKFVKENHRAERVEHFLRDLDICPVNSDDRPISWIELYVLYITRGCETFAVPEHLAFVRPTPDKLIRDFKNCARAVVARTLSETGDAKLFKAAAKTRDQLVGVGILGQNPSLMFNVCVSDAEADVVARALVNLSRKVTNKHVDNFMSGRRLFIPRILTLNGNSDWASTVKRLSPPISVNMLWTPAPVAGVGSAGHVAFYKCKHCDRVEASSCDNFQYDDLDKHIKCNNKSCKRISKVRDWCCACGESWFTCTQHAKHVVQGCLPPWYREQVTGRTADSESSIKRAPRRTAHEYHELLQDDLRRGSKRPRVNSVVTLGDPAELPQRQVKYGVILSERFGASSSSH